MCYLFNTLVKCHLQEDKSYPETKKLLNSFLRNDDGIIRDDYNKCDTKGSQEAVNIGHTFDALC